MVGTGRPRLRTSLIRALAGQGRVEFYTLPHLAAIAEEYSRFLLIKASTALLPPRNALLDDLWLRAEAQAEGAWPQHIDAWKKWHGVMVKQAPCYMRFMGLVEARNAVMHGLGHLTQRQLKGGQKQMVLSQLSAAGIVSGTIILLDRTTLIRCADIAREYIRWLDLEVQGKTSIVG